MNNNISIDASTKNKRNKNFFSIFLVFTIIILSITIGITIYNNYFKEEKIKEEENELQEIISNNYVKEDVSIIKTLDISKTISTEEKESDSFFNDAIFIGNDFIKLLDEYINSVNPKILGSSIFLSSEEISISELLNNNILHEFEGNKKNLKDIIKDTKYKKIFLLLGKEDLKKDQVIETLNNYIALINELKKEKVEVYILSEIYYSKSEEEKNISNSIIRELNYKMNKIKKNLKVDYINISHGMINTNGNTITSFYEKGEYKDAAFNVSINILRDFAEEKINYEKIKNAYEAVKNCEKKLTIESYNEAMKKVKLLNSSEEKKEYLKTLDELYKKITENHSADLTAIYVNGNKINVDSKDNYTYKVSIDTKEVVITANTASPNATITGTDNYKIEKGKNTIRLVVTNKEVTKTYILVIERPADTSITKVKVDGKDVDMETLTVEVSKSATNINLEVSSTDQNAKIEGSGLIDISPDDDYLIFTVNGFTYTLILERK